MTRHRTFDPARCDKTVPQALAAARRRRGASHVVIEDADGRALTYQDMFKAIYALGSALARRTKRGEAVGVMMPTAAPGAIAILALSAYGRVPAMLNFTAGPRNLKAACEIGEVRTIVTAKAFIEKAGLQDLAAMLSEHAELVYLEDVRASLTTRDKAMAVIGVAAPWLIPTGQSPEDAAVILFTSGTEGDPKGVVLAHRALVSNVAQIQAHIPDITDDDIFFCPLPIFHSFGLTGGALLPLLGGLRSVLHPTPLAPREIAQRIKATKATILLGTDTFVSQYARAAQEGDLSGLRFAVCGAERVHDETRALLRRKFDVTLVEGYGVTETAPVLAVNRPSDNRPGTVGQLLPGIEHRIEPVEGIADAGRLVVRGPNVMSGYLRRDGGGKIQPPDGGWHDTGDVVSIDQGGYLRIRGRLKRFAKLGGEMVSLAIAENCAYSLWPDAAHAAAAVPDGRKGEQIVLLTESDAVNREDLLAFVQNHGAPDLAAPKRIFRVEAIPMLGTGKTDYGAVQRLALELATPSKAAPPEA